ncbi:adenine-specific methyltransferase EcoRI family protein [Campylobacter felis]|uniref:adenine-specific methyltransferase EcoRI family protein n=1 Tax=Campylobacter felis TaxID=2974565 RepID=UPI00256B0BF7|nr:adenine-specific methyltransferase EcoRI family protein [Campylobacter felis]
MQKVANTNLHDAKKNKKDEFYTQLSDVENELQHYKAHFKDKIVYCNCDDPLASNFFKYFLLNFKHLDLRGLISTCYKSQNYREVSQEDSPKKAYAIIITKDNAVFKDTGGGGGKPYILDDIEKILELELSQKENQDEKTLKNFEKNLSKLQKKIFPLEADKDSLCSISEDWGQGNAGDFRSKDCIELLKLADIVVTNPPFSLFREYVAQLVEYDKKFLIIGNKNAITYKETFSLIKENKIWLGITSANVFLKPNENRTGFILTKQVNGLTRWFSNLTHKKRNEPLETIASYKKNPEQYPKYDNYDAINVDKTIEIPLDYDGVMGVPITFLDKHNPKQFEIVAKMTTTGIDEFNFGYPYINGKKIYARILIRKIAEVDELRKLEFEKM